MYTEKPNDNRPNHGGNGVESCQMALAFPYIAMQGENTPRYDNAKALERGTLFPGLDLPFMNMVNTADLSGTPLGEVMALQFVCHELHLYLDTHKDDTEAFVMLKKMLKLSREADKRFTAKYGPLCAKDLEYSQKFDWLEDPWPWMYQK